MDKNAEGKTIMEPVFYTHTVHYYETDKMNCVHHSNYIRWFEEARTHQMCIRDSPRANTRRTLSPSCRALCFPARVFANIQTSICNTSLAGAPLPQGDGLPAGLHCAGTLFHQALPRV